MNKQDVVNVMHTQLGLPKADCESALNAFVEIVSDAMAAGKKVTLIGFGTFAAVMRKARTGRNPATGASIEIDAKRVPKFTPGTSLKDKVAG